MKLCQMLAMPFLSTNLQQIMIVLPSSKIKDFNAKKGNNKIVANVYAKM